jgi:hypothetical protein
MTAFGLVTCLVLAQSSAKFFPIDNKNGIDLLEEARYAKVLRAMEEQPLHTGTTKGTVYRLTILPSWGNPVTIRLNVIDGQGGYELGKLIEKGLAPVSAETLATFEQLFATLNFEKQATRDPTVGFDGSTYVLEQVAEGRYHVIVRWTPSSDTSKRGLTEFQAVAQSMYRASPLKADLTNKGRVEIRKNE